MITRSKNGIFKPKAHIATKHPLPTDDLVEPSCFSQANKDPNWRDAMSQEISALLKNGTWTLVAPKPYMNIVGCKLVFKLKRKANGSIDRHKA